MKIIDPSVELVRDFDGDEIMKFLEMCGRTCYKSDLKDSEKFIRNIIKRGHESVLEHFSCTFRIICDRGIMAEITRHRLCSFSIESTRWCDYMGDRFGGTLTFIKPPVDEKNYIAWENAMYRAEDTYFTLRKNGARPEQARAVLPNSLKTEIIMTANLREWRTILKLRTAKDAHPQMREIAFMILQILKEKLPVIFEDIGGDAQ